MNKSDNVILMNIGAIAGLQIILLSILMAIKLEGSHILTSFTPSIFCIVFGITFGGVFFSFRPAEILTAIRVVFTQGIKCSPEELRAYSRIFSLLSKYSWSAGWFGIFFGGLHVLFGIDEFTKQGRIIAYLTESIAMVLMSPLYGIVLSKYIFDPMKNNIERRIEFPTEITSEQIAPPMPLPDQKRILFKIILFSSFAVVLITLIILISWKISKPH